MELSIQREDLLKPLQMISGAVERKQTLPILSNVLLTADENEVNIVATDLEIELRGLVRVENIKETGELTVNAKKLLDICRTLPSDAEIKLSSGKNRLLIRSGKSRFTLSTLPAAEFPTVEQGKGNAHLTLLQGELKLLLEKTYFAMAQQDVRYYLNGMLFYLNNDQIKLIATDGHRLSLALMNKQDLMVNDLQVIIPRKGIIELMKLLEDDSEEVELSIGDNHIYAKTQEFTFTSKLVEGKFPDYRNAIPKGGDKIVLIDRGVLKQALSRVSILSNEKYRGIRLLFKPNQLTLFTSNPDQEEAEEEIPIDYQGPELEIGFNVNYLIDICNITLTDQLQITLADANTSALIEEVGVSDYIYIVMPMRI